MLMKPQPIMCTSVRINGQQLFDSMDNGTEFVDPVIVDGTCKEDTELAPPTTDETTPLCIVGTAMRIYPAPPYTTGEPPNDNPGLHYEEIIEAEGVVEELFAYDYEEE